jgi:hypothetical protein
MYSHKSIFMSDPHGSHGPHGYEPHVEDHELPEEETEEDENEESEDEKTEPPDSVLDIRDLGNRAKADKVASDREAADLLKRLQITSIEDVKKEQDRFAEDAEKRNPRASVIAAKR